MSELELKRRKVHGVLSSKSLLEALEKLTLNKSASESASFKSSINIKNKYNNNDVILFIELFFFNLNNLINLIE
jgi:hypothetical protein